MTRSSLLRTLTVLTAAVALLATGCAPRATAPRNADGRGEVSGSIRFAWWGSAQRNEKTNAVADLFQKAHPGTDVSREAADFGNYFHRLNVQAASGSMPCVTQLQGRQLADFTERDALLPLDPVIESGAIDVSHIPEAVLDTGRGADGNLYMLPFGAAYDALVVNRTLARKAGAELPGRDHDWRDLVSFLRDAKNGLPPGTAPTALRGGLPNYFIAYVEGHGEHMFSGKRLGFSKKFLADYWRMWEGLRKEGLTNSPAAVSEEPTQPEAGYLAQGNVLSDNRPGNALTPAQKTLDGTRPGQRLTTLALPRGPHGSGNVLITSGLSIPANCDNVPTAAAFLDYWTNAPEAGDTYNSDNGAATNTRLLQRQLDDPAQPELKKQELRLYKRIVERGPSQVSYPPGYTAVFESAFTRAYEEISFGRMSIDQAVDSFFTEARAGLEG